MTIDRVKNDGTMWAPRPSRCQDQELERETLLGAQEIKKDRDAGNNSSQ